MPELDRIRVNWSGLQGGQGVSTFYAQPVGPGPIGLLRNFFIAIAGAIPSAATISFENTGDTIDEATGALTGTWSVPSVAPVGGGGPGAYASPVGVFVKWGTGLVANGRRLQGKTFLVPVIGSTFDSNGTPIADRLATLQAAVDDFVDSSAGVFRIYSRPFVPKLGSTRPAHAGISGPIVSGTVPDTAAILKGRRD